MLTTIPPTMKVGVKKVVEVRIADRPGPGFNQGVQGEGSVVVETISVSSFMTVKLTGEDFDVDPIHSVSEQTLEHGHARWVWDVTPRKSGPRELHLEVTARVKTSDGDQGFKVILVERKHIVVSVNHRYTVEQFFGSHWKEIIPISSALPLMGGTLTWMWRRRKK